MSEMKNPWEEFDSFNPASFRGKEGAPVQWPLKLWKASKVSPYYHRAHLLIAADCSAFSYAGFHDGCASGKVLLICCPDTDFDIATKLSDILKNNDILSVTVVKMAARCCGELLEEVKQALRICRKPIPLQYTNLFISGENLEEDAEDDWPRELRS